jgi:glycerophosphoryl diester phosphodiesterase
MRKVLKKWVYPIVFTATLLGNLFPFRGDFSPRTGVYENIPVSYAQKEVIAHRGGMEKYRENTLEAFSHTKNTGADKAELDIRKTKDGVYVVYHDRMIKGSFIKNLTYEEVNNSSRNSGYSVPKLEEVLSVLKRDGRGVIADLKISGDEKEVVDILKRYIAKKDIIISSKIPSSLKKIKRIDSELKTSYLMGSGIPYYHSYIRRKLGIVPWRDLKESGADYISIKGDDLNKGFYKNLSRGDARALVYDIDGKRARDILKYPGVKGVIVDNPSEAVKPGTEIKKSQVRIAKDLTAKDVHERRSLESIAKIFLFLILIFFLIYNTLPYITTNTINNNLLEMNSKLLINSGLFIVLIILIIFFILLRINKK